MSTQVIWKCQNKVDFPDVIFNFSKMVCVLPSTWCMTGELWPRRFIWHQDIRVTHCQSSAMSFIFTQYSFCNSFRHGLVWACSWIQRGFFRLPLYAMKMIFLMLFLICTFKAPNLAEKRTKLAENLFQIWTAMSLSPWVHHECIFWDSAWIYYIVKGNYEIWSWLDSQKLWFSFFIAEQHVSK